MRKNDRIGFTVGTTATPLIHTCGPTHCITPSGYSVHFIARPGLIHAASSKQSLSLAVSSYPLSSLSVSGPRVAYLFGKPTFSYHDKGTSDPSGNFDIMGLNRSLKILVAEDDDINFMFIEYLFSNSGHVLVRALNGKHATEIFEKQPDFDIILMDLKMPVMSGFEATRIIKSIAPRIPVIALTAYVFDDDRQRAMHAGCDDFIVKPYTMENLFDRIKRLVS